MAHAEKAHPARPRIAVDVSPELRRRLRLAAARRDVPLGRYALEAIEERLRADELDSEDTGLALNAATDPVLAELWDNESDAVYDSLAPR